MFLTYAIIQYSCLPYVLWSTCCSGRTSASQPPTNPSVSVYLNMYDKVHYEACDYDKVLYEACDPLVQVVQLLNGNLSCFKGMKKTRMPFFRRVFREELHDSE